MIDGTCSWQSRYKLKMINLASMSFTWISFSRQHHTSIRMRPTNVEKLKNSYVSYTTTIDFMIGAPIYWNWLSESVYASVEGKTYAIIYSTFLEKCDVHNIHDAEEKPIYIYRLPRLFFLWKKWRKRNFPNISILFSDFNDIFCPKCSIVKRYLLPSM